jgi:D-alanyl-D-alanine carboxypeptidase (penicillin-binding protein 5/6)
MRLVSVVLGAASDTKRVTASRALFGYGFRFFETHKLYDAAKSLTTVRVWKGDIDNLDLGLTQPLWVTIPRGQYKKLNATMDVDPRIIAPVPMGDSRGKLKVTFADQPLLERPLVSLQDVHEGGIVSRLSDQVLMLFN